MPAAMKQVGPKPGVEKEMKSVVSPNIFGEPFWIYFYQKVYQQIDAKTDTEKT